VEEEEEEEERVRCTYAVEHRPTIGTGTGTEICIGMNVIL